MKQVLWITVKETVSRNVGLTIGEDISQDAANELMKITDEEDEFAPHSKEYQILNDHLENSMGEDSDGFTDVQVYIKKP